MRLLFLKRPFDFVISFLGIIISLPLWLLIGIIILMEDGLPIFYCQERTGKNRQVFRVLKFRSMVKGAEKQGLWTNEDDPRITKIGCILRKTAMDELPSLLNILKGDMSFVGPKPLAVGEQLILEKKIPGFEKRLEVKPGLTGLAQVYNSDDDPYRKLQYDLEYINKINFWLDLKLFLLSFYNTFTFRWDKRSGKKTQQL